MKLLLNIVYENGLVSDIHLHWSDTFL